MLEETLAEAQTAVPLEAMEERLRWDNRTTGLINGPAQTRSLIATILDPSKTFTTRRSEVTDTPAKNP